MDKILFSERLSQLRKERGYQTQNALAVEYNNRFPSTRKGKKEENTSGILGTIKNYENANHPGNPNLDIVINLCDILECDIDYLVGKIECKKHDTQFIQNKTGLSEQAINSLSYAKSIKSKRVMAAINILICNLFKKDKIESKQSFFDLLANYLFFSGNNKEYYIDQRGDISPATPYEAANGEKYHPANKLLLYSNQLEQMYIMEMEDELKSIKKNMNKAPGTN